MYQGITPTPDSNFVKKLHRYDSTLKCNFDRELSKFVITQPSMLNSGRKVALVVKDWEHEGGWRQPDERDIARIAMADFHRKSIRRRIQEGEDYMLNYRDKQDRKAAEELRDMTKDEKLPLVNAYRESFNLGKKIRPHRPIKPKVKGKVFK